MATIIGEYQSDLRTKLTHESSKTIIYTDAPPDNQGKGESFSPTDLLAASLGSCMVTIMGIKAESIGLILKPFQFKIIKTMNSLPRKVKELKVELYCSKELMQKDRFFLEKEAKNCPVALSLDPELNQNITFNYI